MKNSYLFKIVSIFDLNIKVLFVETDTEPQLIIYHKNLDEDWERLAWHLIATPNLLERWEYFIDAKNGDIIHKINTTCTISPHELFENHVMSSPMEQYRSTL